MDLPWAVIWALVGIAVELVGLFFAFDAVQTGRTPQGTIAWVAGLIAFPPASVPLYLVFGTRRSEGYVRARRKGILRINHLAIEVHAALAPYRGATPGVLDPARLDVMDVLPTTGSNRARLLIDGAATYDAIIQTMDGAAHYALVQFYIVRDDAAGRRLLDAIARARARGIRVYFLYDSIGSSSLSRAYLAELRSLGADVRDFRPSRAPRFRSQLNFRNHRKIVIADGRVALLGGLNVGIEYLGLDPRFGAWRDTHVQLNGPSALAVQLAFVEDWFCCTRVVPDLCWVPVPAGSDPGEPEREGARVAIVPTGPADELEACKLMFLHLIHSARKRLWIATPYFVPDEAVLAALQAASLRGTDVRVLVPARPDQMLVHLAARSYIDDALAAGVRVFRYTEGFMHQKVVLTDRIAAVGTANLDNRSIRINFEITALIEDKAFTDAVGEMLVLDFTRADELPRHWFRRQRWSARLAARAARLLSPIL